MDKVPFNITKYEDEELSSELTKFKVLFKKYKDNIEEILEFSRLYEKFMTRKSKWQ